MAHFWQHSQNIYQLNSTKICIAIVHTTKIPVYFHLFYIANCRPCFTNCLWTSLTPCKTMNNVSCTVAFRLTPSLVHFSLYRKLARFLWILVSRTHHCYLSFKTEAGTFSLFICKIPLISVWLFSYFNCQENEFVWCSPSKSYW